MDRLGEARLTRIGLVLLAVGIVSVFLLADTDIQTLERDIRRLLPKRKPSYAFNLVVRNWGVSMWRAIERACCMVYRGHWGSCNNCWLRLFGNSLWLPASC